MVSVVERFSLLFFALLLSGSQGYGQLSTCINLSGNWKLAGLHNEFVFTQEGCKGTIRGPGYEYSVFGDKFVLYQDEWEIKNEGKQIVLGERMFVKVDSSDCPNLSGWWKMDAEEMDGEEEEIDITFKFDQTGCSGFVNGHERYTVTDTGDFEWEQGWSGTIQSEDKKIICEEAGVVLTKLPGTMEAVAEVNEDTASNDSNHRVFVFLAGLITSFMIMKMHAACKRERAEEYVTLTEDSVSF